MVGRRFVLKITRHSVSALGNTPARPPTPQTKCHDDRSFAGVAASSSENSQPPAQPASASQPVKHRQGPGQGRAGCRAAGLDWLSTDMRRFSFSFSPSLVRSCRILCRSLSLLLSKPSLTGPVASILEHHPPQARAPPPTAPHASGIRQDIATRMMCRCSVLAPFGVTCPGEGWRVGRIIIMASLPACFPATHSQVQYIHGRPLPCPPALV